MLDADSAFVRRAVELAYKAARLHRAFCQYIADGMKSEQHGRELLRQHDELEIEKAANLSHGLADIEREERAGREAWLQAARRRLQKGD